jgi:hypothetical protein
MSRRILLPLVFAAMIVPPVMAQEKTAPSDSGNKENTDRRDRGNNDSGGDRRGWDPAQARERMSNWMKEQLAVNDEEWKVIQPKVEKVFNVRRDASGGGGFFGGRSRGGDESAPKSTVQQASSDLRATLDKKESTADEIKSKLTALREAREKAKVDLVTAQKELKEVLTQRQEATMVMLGMLD